MRMAAVEPGRDYGSIVAKNVEYAKLAVPARPWKTTSQTIVPTLRVHRWEGGCGCPPRPGKDATKSFFSLHARLPIAPLRCPHRRLSEVWELERAESQLWHKLTDRRHKYPLRCLSSADEVGTSWWHVLRKRH